MNTPNTLSRLDKRARWTRWLTFLGGSVFGLLFDWEDLLPALRHQPYTDGPHSPASLLGILIGGTVLPVAVTLVALHKSFSGPPPPSSSTSPGASWTASPPTMSPACSATCAATAPK